MDKEAVIIYIYIIIHTHTHTQNGILLSHKKKHENLLFATTWMDLKSIMLGDIRQTERQIPYVFTYMWNG